MKKIITILLVAFAFALPAIAQQAPRVLTTTAYGNALDTVDNSESHVTTPSLGLVSNWKAGVTAHVIVTKISGTVGGSIALQGSMDATNWSTIGSASTPTDATANYSFNSTVAWRYYRINYTGTGTMSASFKSYLYPY